QEFMIVPAGFDSFSTGLRAGVETFHHLKKVLHDKKLSTSVGDEGGFAPDLKTNEEAIQLILTAIEKAGYTPGTEIKIALDCASTEYFDPATSHYDIENKKVSREATVELLAGWVDKYPICSIEDGCSEDDWEGWKMLTEAIGGKCQLVG